MSTPKFSRLDPAQRREQILDAANALFAERAYDEVSIEDIASSAGVTRGLVHHYFGGRKEVYIGLLERIGAQREDQLRPPAGRTSRARVAHSVSRWLDWTQANRTIWLATMAPGEDIADPEVRRVVADLVRRAVRATHDLPRRHRRGLAAAALRARMLDRAQQGRDATLAEPGGHPRGDA
jgi:AcrR family transcriptional regulator